MNDTAHAAVTDQTKLRIAKPAEAMPPIRSAARYHRYP